MPKVIGKLDVNLTFSGLLSRLFNALPSEAKATLQLGKDEVAEPLNRPTALQRKKYRNRITKAEEGTHYAISRQKVR